MGRRGTTARLLVSLLVPVTGIAVMILSGLVLGPAISAAEGHGARGYFIARAESCGRGPCTWNGDLRLPDGAVTRTGVDLLGYSPALRAGASVPAVDTGSPFAVFAAHDSAVWLVPAGEFAFGMLLAGVWLAAAAVAFHYRKARIGSGRHSREAPT